MATFSLERNRSSIERAVKNASEFIDILSFQFTSREIVSLLIAKAQEGVSIRIISLPEDSYREITQRKEIEQLYDSLIQKGIEFNRCIWEVGVPELTETSLSGEQTEGGGNKWYSLHGKFVVTEREAIATSLNFTDDAQLEVYLSYDDVKTVETFSAKFDFLKAQFCSKDLPPGLLYSKLPQELQQEAGKLFEQSGRINIKEYPPELSPEREIKQGLYLSPFEGRARSFFNQLIEEAKEFIYLSSERVFDEEAVKVLLSKAYLTDIPIKIMTRHPRTVRQNPSKAEKMIADLMAAGVEVIVIDDIHAKLWLTDNWLCVTSANLGKMNLGFAKSGNYWRANTETLWFDDDHEIINSARNALDSMLQTSKSGIVALSDVGAKKSRAKDLFALFGYRSKKEAKVLMARIETQFTIENRQNIIRVAKLSARLAEIEATTFITEEHVIMANILFYLRERKHDLSEIKEKMVKIVEKDKIVSAIKNLQKHNYVVKEHEYYTINIERLLVREKGQSYLFEKPRSEKT